MPGEYLFWLFLSLLNNILSPSKTSEVIRLLNLINQKTKMHKAFPAMLLCSFAVLSFFIFNGCATFHSSQIQEREKIQFGLASWYGDQFHGAKTSSGETYDRDLFTAAHRALPFGTIVKVTNIKNGRSAFVKINDRGPHKTSRKLDLSYVAAKKLGMINDGVVRIRLEIIEDDYVISLYEQQKSLWQLYNTDAQFFKRMADPYGIRLSLSDYKLFCPLINEPANQKFDEVSLSNYKNKNFIIALN